MTASERLRELGDRQAVFGWAEGRPAAHVLWDALPLIADVVEAAETMNVRWYGPWQRNGLKLAAKRQREALTALKEALDAS